MFLTKIGMSFGLNISYASLANRGADRRRAALSRSVQWSDGLGRCCELEANNTGDDKAKT